jgi:hypothetical protein
MLLQDNPNQSALLRCLSLLNVDTWAQVLLPKLISQGLAGNVALACRQLRDLCFGAVQHINLSSVQDSELSDVDVWALTLSLHFSNAKSAQLLLSDEASYHRAPYLLPALARCVLTQQCLTDYVTECQLLVAPACHHIL